MIDRQLFKEHFSYFDTALVVEIIDMFFDEFEQRFQDLHDNVASRDFDSLHKNAHSLKGVISNFWDPVPVELTKRLDEMAKNKLENGLENTLSELEQSSRLLLEELGKIKKELI